MSIIIAGVSLPKNKKLPFALRYIKGIGLYTAKKICNDLNLDQELRLENFEETDLVRIRERLEEEMIENDLRIFVSNQIKAQKQLRTYRGRRHERNLPVRGQRTHSNAETRRSGKA